MTTTAITNKVTCSSVQIAYKTPSGTWRGYVHPYDITTEMASKEEVLEAIGEMCELYENMLEEFGHPEHLAQKPTSNAQDSLVFDKNLLKILHSKGAPINEDSFYAKTVSAA